jgi:hypothetical protein
MVIIKIRREVGKDDGRSTLEAQQEASFEGELSWIDERLSSTTDGDCDAVRSGRRQKRCKWRRTAVQNVLFGCRLRVASKHRFCVMNRRPRKHLSNTFRFPSIDRLDDEMRCSAPTSLPVAVGNSRNCHLIEPSSAKTEERAASPTFLSPCFQFALFLLERRRAQVRNL